MNLSEYIKPSTYTRIKVIPQQSKTEVRDVMDDGTIKIALKSAPEKGKANKELIEFVAKEMGVSRDQVRIVSGVSSRVKILVMSD